jgi:hypothetical protein
MRRRTAIALDLALLAAAWVAASADNARMICENELAQLEAKVHAENEWKLERQAIYKTALR